MGFVILFPNDWKYRNSGVDAVPIINDWRALAFGKSKLTIWVAFSYPANDMPKRETLAGIFYPTSELIILSITATTLSGESVWKLKNAENWALLKLNDRARNNIIIFFIVNIFNS